MATITRAADLADRGIGISNADVNFYLSDESPSLETEDQRVIDSVTGNPNFVVSESAAEPAAFVYNQEGTE